MSGSDPQRRVVSAYSYVDPSKVGKSFAAAPNGAPFVGVTTTVSSAAPPDYNAPPTYQASAGDASVAPEPTGAAAMASGAAARGAKPRATYPTDDFKPANAAPSARGGSKSGASKALIVAVVALVVGLAWSHFATSDAIAVISRVHWRRTVQVDELRVVTASGFELPVGATVVSTEMRARAEGAATVSSMTSTTTRRRCTTRETVSWENRYVRTDNVCVDDGTCTATDVFEKVEVRTPVEECGDEATTNMAASETLPSYAPYYIYTHEVWTRLPALVAEGDNSRAHWPDVPSGPRVRTVDESAVYELVLTDADDATRTWVHSVDESVAAAVRVGARVPLEFNYWGVTKLHLTLGQR